jgi:hypothetical protein
LIQPPVATLISHHFEPTNKHHLHHESNQSPNAKLQTTTTRMNSSSSSSLFPFGMNDYPFDSSLSSSSSFLHHHQQQQQHYQQQSHARSRIAVAQNSSSGSSNSSSSNNNTSFVCFGSSAELKAAIGGYVASASASPAAALLSDAAQLYGYPINTWCVSAITDFTGAFRPRNNLDPLAMFNENVAGWDMSHAVVLDSMFEGAIAFNQDLSSWNLTAVQSMTRMFFGSISFNQDLCAWADTLLPQLSSINVTDLFNYTQCPAAGQDPHVPSGTTTAAAGPFCYPCRSLLNNATATTEAPIFHVNATKAPGLVNATKAPGLVNATKTPGLVNATKAPAGRKATESPSAAPSGLFWNTTQPPAAVATTTNLTCFKDKVELELALDAYLVDSGNNTDVAATYGWPINAWCVGAVTNFSSLFSPVTNVLKDAFNEDIDAWDLSAAKDVSNMFHGASFFNQDVSSWTFGPNLTNMHRMFFNAQSFDQNLCVWNRTVPATATTTQIFRNTACPYNTLDPPNAWCYVCPVVATVETLAPSSSPSSSPTGTAPNGTTPTPSNTSTPSTPSTPSDAPSMQPSMAPAHNSIYSSSPSSSSPVQSPPAVPQVKASTSGTMATTTLRNRGPPTALAVAIFVGMISVVLLLT